MTPTPEQLAQWEREAEDRYPIDPYRPLHYYENNAMTNKRIGYQCARLKAHQEQSARIQELEGLLMEVHTSMVVFDGNRYQRIVIDRELRDRITATLSGGGGTTSTHS